MNEFGDCEVCGYTENLPSDAYCFVCGHDLWGCDESSDDPEFEDERNLVNQ